MFDDCFAGLRTAATITFAFALEGEWVSQAGLKSGTLSVVKVSGDNSIRMIMSASDIFLRIMTPGFSINKGRWKFAVHSWLVPEHDVDQAEKDQRKDKPGHSPCLRGHEPGHRIRPHPAQSQSHQTDNVFKNNEKDEIEEDEIVPNRTALSRMPTSRRSSMFGPSAVIFDFCMGIPMADVTAIYRPAGPVCPPATL